MCNFLFCLFSLPPPRPCKVQNVSNSKPVEVTVFFLPPPPVAVPDLWPTFISVFYSFSKYFKLIQRPHDFLHSLRQTAADGKRRNGNMAAVEWCEGKQLLRTRRFWWGLSLPSLLCCFRNVAYCLGRLDVTLQKNWASDGLLHFKELGCHCCANKGFM
jgi:hypothetical protein